MSMPVKVAVIDNIHDATHHQMDWSDVIGCLFQSRHVIGCFFKSRRGSR